MKAVNYKKLYKGLGTVLCGCAGAIVGFVFGGPILAIPAAIVGIFGGQFIETQVS